MIENIDSIDGLDKMQSEIDLYSIDESLSLIDDDLSFAKYWTEVGKFTEGGWTKYEVLLRFALALGTFFNSNSYQY